ncbi:hypothetical protein DY000_02011153 [Brassica cretica]|uniref:Reverse transcriptase zinc-binding domain-containing protein n=1 Tax=Brassica cretica TaxID=69181 RepID=A0ABQ7CUJ9_BRACR|nr:hypothetical protein DY000_02011153 [Brassica cretica]
MINEMKIGRNLGERRRHPNMLQRKKYHLTPAGRRALLKIKRRSSLATTNSTMPCLDAPMVKKMSSLATTSTMPCLDAPLRRSSLATTNSTMPCLDAPMVKKMSSLATTSTMPCLDAPLKMSSPHDVTTTTTTTMPQSPSRMKMEELKEWGKRGLVPPGARGILSCKGLTVPYLFLDESAKGKYRASSHRSRRDLVSPIPTLRAPETRDHLFFDCNFSFSTWSALATKARTPQIRQWNQVVNYMQSIQAAKHIRLLQLLAWQTAVYFIWTERNSRIHRGSFRSVDSITSVASSLIKNKISSLRNSSPQLSSSMIQIWLSD